MAERRPLIEGLKPPPTPIDPDREREFVFGGKGKGEGAANVNTYPETAVRPQPLARAPFTTRIRADYAAALKRASLERQLSNTSPSTLQEILEEALGPWLKANGYVS